MNNQAIQIFGTDLSRGLIIVFIMALSASPARSQQVEQEIYDRFLNLDIDYFFDQDVSYHDHPFRLALQNYIAGDQIKYIEYLREARQSATGKMKTQISKLLFQALVNEGKKNQAFMIDAEDNLGMDPKADTDYAKSVFGKATLEMHADTTSLDFDQFYLTAVVNGRDSVRVLLDTGAPGVTVSKDLVTKYSWETDTTYYGSAVLASFGIRYKTIPVLVPEIKFGNTKIQNVTASYGELTKADQRKLEESGVEQADIIMGLDVFYGLIDKVIFDYPKRKIHLIKSVDAVNDPPNFVVVSGKPAINFEVGDNRIKAFIDTGSPRHVFSEETINAIEVLDKRKESYGDYEFQLNTLVVDHLLNMNNLKIEAADYGYVADRTFMINHWFGSFMNFRLSFDLRNRIVTLIK